MPAVGMREQVLQPWSVMADRCASLSDEIRGRCAASLEQCPERRDHIRCRGDGGDLDIADSDGWEPAVHGRQQICQRIPESALPMAASVAREQWWLRLAEATAALAPGKSPRAGQPLRGIEAELHACRIVLQGHGAGPGEVLFLVDLQDLLLPVLVGQQNVQPSPLTRRGLLGEDQPGERTVDRRHQLPHGAALDQPRPQEPGRTALWLDLRPTMGSLGGSMCGRRPRSPTPPPFAELTSGDLLLTICKVLSSNVHCRRAARRGSKTGSMDIDESRDSENDPEGRKRKSDWLLRVLIALLSAIAGGVAQAVAEKLMES